MLTVVRAGLARVDGGMEDGGLDGFRKLHRGQFLAVDVKRVERHGHAYFKALEQIAAKQLEQPRLPFAFYAFDNDAHIEAVAEFDHGADDLRRLPLFVGVLQERLVEFEAIKFDMLKVAQRGIAGAECAGVAWAEVGKGKAKCIGIKRAG